MVGAFEDLNLNLECYGQTNPEGRARLTRRLIMDLVFIVIFDTEYSTIPGAGRPKAKVVEQPSELMPAGIGPPKRLQGKIVT